VALGQDDIADAYYPLGNNNMLAVAFVAVHVLEAVSQPALTRHIRRATSSPAVVSSRSQQAPRHCTLAELSGVRASRSRRFAMLTNKKRFLTVCIAKAPECTRRSRRLLDRGLVGRVE
jgi:hypothetical protein